MEVAKIKEEDDDDLLDKIQGRITSAQETMKAAKDLSQALLASRYRLPDTEFETLVNLETEFNAAVELASRLRGTTADSKGKGILHAEHGVRAMDVFQYITAAFSGQGDNPKKDFISPKALGWHTVRIRRAGALHAELDVAPDLEAAETNENLDELEGLETSAA